LFSPLKQRHFLARDTVGLGVTQMAFSGTASWAIIPGLEEFTVYQLVIGAVNGAGMGGISNPISATTAEGVPSGPPTLLSAGNVTAQTAKVRLIVRAGCGGSTKLLMEIVLCTNLCGWLQLLCAAALHSVFVCGAM